MCKHTHTYTHTHITHFCQLRFWIDHLSKGKKNLSIIFYYQIYYICVLSVCSVLLKWIFIITFVYFEQSSLHKIRKDNLLIKPFTNQWWCIRYVLTSEPNFCTCFFYCAFGVINTNVFVFFFIILLISYF